jgi:hypothetical protein
LPGGWHPLAGARLSAITTTAVKTHRELQKLLQKTKKAASSGAAFLVLIC